MNVLSSTPHSSIISHYVFRPDGTGQFDLTHTSGQTETHSFTWHTGSANIVLDYQPSAQDEWKQWSAQMQWSVTDDGQSLTLTGDKDMRAIFLSTMQRLSGGAEMSVVSPAIYKRGDYHPSQQSASTQPPALLKDPASAPADNSQQITQQPYDNGTGIDYSQPAYQETQQPSGVVMGTGTQDTTVMRQVQVTQLPQPPAQNYYKEAPQRYYQYPHQSAQRLYTFRADKPYLTRRTGPNSYVLDPRQSITIVPSIPTSQMTPHELEEYANAELGLAASGHSPATNPFRNVR
jgi:hypothetical protein